MSNACSNLSSWITCYVPRPHATVRLICIPHGGGGAQIYKEWAEQLPEFIEVLALSFPARGSRWNEPAVDNMPELINEITASLQPYLNKPYAIFGHSVGALVAYELVANLRDKGMMLPMRLIVSAHETPANSCVDTQAETPMYQLSDEALLAKIGELGLVPSEALQNEELIRFILPAIRADFKLSETYQYQPSQPLNLPITATIGVKDTLLTPTEMEQWQDYTDTSTGKATDKDKAFAMRTYKGDHFYTVSEQTQVLADIAEELNADLQALPLSIMQGETVDYPQKCLHELFREQAKQYPERTALVDIHQSLTFAELDTQTDLLAHELQRRGVGVDSIVSIFMDSSVEYVVAYLAILKAGGAYMPLEIAYPNALLTKVLQRTTPVCVLTTDDYISLLPNEWQQDRHTFSLIQGWSDTLAKSELPPLDKDRALPTPDSLAYCVMTSGTTGEPKGIICPHRGAVNSYYWRYRNYPYQQGEREACNVFFVWEVIRPLLQGMPAYVIPDDVIYDPWQLVEFLQTHEITRVLFTPSLLEQILNSTDSTISEKLANLQIVWLNGEVVPTALCKRFFERFPNTKLLNDYSISEAHDVCTYDLAHLNTSYSPRYASLGKPMSNVQIYLLDEELQPVPQGVPAEIYIGGDSLACGYLQDPEKTAERFIPNPFTDPLLTSSKEEGNNAPNNILFRTGDLGRILPNGELEVAGRIEFMVKLRGYSIVPTAVESTINQHRGVDSSVVMTKDDEETGQPEALVAYVVTNGTLSDTELQGDLRHFLKDNLPHYAVPTYLIILQELPINTVTGKLDRKKLPKPTAQPQANNNGKSSKLTATTQTEQLIIDAWTKVLKVAPTSLTDNFFDLGGHSLLAIQVCRALSQQLEDNVSVIDIFQYPTVQSLANMIDNRQGDTPDDEDDLPTRKIKGDAVGINGDDIAIVGLAGRFPQADTIDEFWSNIRDGKCSIRELSDEELDKNGVPKSVYSDENYRKVGAILDNVDLFDPQFWQLSQKEANLIDPQQRLFLETCWHAMEHAGYTPDSEKHTGVFGGCYSPLYLLHNLAGGGFMDATDPMDYHITETGNDKDYLTTRVSYLMNLQGPSVAVQSSCSTALSVVATACQSLQAHHCDMALAGASSITFPQAGYQYVEGHINSKDGKVRTFDANASGTILGDGVGVVVLKRLQDAIEDNDTIYAVIKGYATNNDGNEKMGYSAPSVKGQKSVVRQALRSANVSAEDISYVEAHGTGTLIGDPIESKALTEVFRKYSDKNNYCALGSVKPNIGHSNISAGMASLMKVALSLHHKQIPPTINYETPNPVMDIDNSPFYINKELINWEVAEDKPRIAGVSCLGIGGTNNHFILQQAPDVKPNDNEQAENESLENQRKHHLLVVSGKTAQAVERNKIALADYLEKHADLNLNDLNLNNIEFTLQTGRCQFDYRSAIACTDLSSAINKLRSSAYKVQQVRTPTDNQAVSATKTVFVFPGQGSQYQQMGYHLYQNEPVFKKYFDECCDILQAELSDELSGELGGELGGKSSIDLRDMLFAESDSDLAKQTFQYAYYTQPLIVANQIAMARMLMDWGVQPDAVIGHSIGEYTASYVAGIFSLEDTLKLITARGRAMEKAGEGRMLSATLNESEARKLLENAEYAEDVSLGVINSATNMVFSGTVSAIDKLQAQLTAQGTANQAVNVKQAFHSAMMSDASQELIEAVQPLKRNIPTMPIMSNVTGKWLTDEQVSDDNYWAEHMRATVRFADNVTGLLEHYPSHIIEVGSHTILSRLVSTFTAQMAEEERPLIVTCSRHPKDTSTTDTQALDNAIAQLWSAGYTIDWQAYRNHCPARKIGLTGYSFEPQSCWMNKGAIQASSNEMNQTSNANSMITDIAKRGYMPSWSRSPFPAVNKELSEQNWLVFADNSKLSNYLLEKLTQAGARVQSVYPSDFDQQNPQSYADCLNQLAENGNYPNRILYLWSVTDKQADNVVGETFYTLLNVAKGLAMQNCLDPVEMWLVTNDTFQINGEFVEPLKSTLLAPAIVLPQECPQIACRVIDVPLADLTASTKTASTGKASTQKRLLNEISVAHADVEPFIVLRGTKRWVKRYEPFAIPPVAQAENGEKESGLHQDGVYLITGGLGRIANALTEHLANHYQAKLILTTTRAFPPKEQWADYLQANGKNVENATANQRTKDSIQHLMALEKAGAEVAVVSTHLHTLEAIRSLLSGCISRFGGLHGIFHLAGLADLKYLPDLDVATCEKEFQPKIDALLHLEQVLGECIQQNKGMQTDFVMLFSSLASILGGYGMTAYTSANRFMDTFVQVNPWRQGVRWYCVNWDDWDFDYSKEQVGAYEQTVAQYSMSASDGLETIERILALPEPQQILVSTRPLQPRVEQWLQQHAQGQNQGAEDSDTQTDNMNANDENSLSTRILNIYRDVLAMEDLTEEDNFFAVGGDSLLASQILLKLRRELKEQGKALTLASIFDYPTAGGLAEWLEG